MHNGDTQISHGTQELTQCSEETSATETLCLLVLDLFTVCSPTAGLTVNPSTDYHQYCDVIKRQIVMGDKVRLMENSIWKHFLNVDHQHQTNTNRNPWKDNRNRT